MKKYYRLLYLMIPLFILFNLLSYADPPDPPPPPGNHGLGGNSSAPVDGGSGILLLMGIGYAAKKIYGNGNSGKKR